MFKLNEILATKPVFYKIKTYKLLMFVKRQIKALKMFGPKTWCTKKNLLVIELYNTDTFYVLYRTFYTKLNTCL